MLKFLHNYDDNNDAKAIPIPQVFSKNSQAKKCKYHERNIYRSKCCIFRSSRHFWYKLEVSLLSIGNCSIVVIECDVDFVPILPVIKTILDPFPHILIFEKEAFSYNVFYPSLDKFQCFSHIDFP